MQNRVCLSAQAIYLTPPNAEKITKGEKTLIIKGSCFKNTVGHLYYYIQNNEAYGVLKIKKLYPIDLHEFEELNKSHLLTNEEREKMWPNKEILFAYEFELVNSFDKPKKIILPKNLQTFNNIEFKYQLNKSEILSELDVKRLDERSKVLEKFL